MGYTLSIVTPPVSRNDAEAWKQIDDLIDKQRGTRGGGRTLAPLSQRPPKPTPPPEFRQLYDLLVERYPCLCSLPDGQEEDTIWSDGPLWNNFGTRVAILGIRHQCADEALPFIVESANSLGLIVFEPAMGVIFRPEAR